MKKFFGVRGVTFLLIGVIASSGFADIEENFNSAEWRQSIAKGYVPYRQLTVKDFKVNDFRHHGGQIHTEGFIDYKCKTSVERSGNRFVAKVTQWTVRSGINLNECTRKSFLRDIERWLPHEQLHIDLNELNARALGRRSLSELPIGEGAYPAAATQDLEAKLKKMIDMLWVSYRQEQARYDSETKHGVDEGKQQEWNLMVRARMQQAGIRANN